MTQIALCPILYPTSEDFSDFNRYIHHLESTYKSTFGMVKIVPPKQWKAKTSNYQSKLSNLIIKNPIQQNAQGLGGFMESKNIVQPRMSFRKYKKYALEQSKKVENKTVSQKRKLFWKTLPYSPPIYGADLTSSLMENIAGQWNLNHLNSLLNQALKQRVKGVTQPYCYIGSWKTYFCWHKQDLDLSAINYLHEGEAKVWYAIVPQQDVILERQAGNHFKSQQDKCKNFMRHKTTLINPDILSRSYPELKISTAEQGQNEIIVVFGGGYHCGFNCGFNIAEAVNFATNDWLKQLINCSSCTCSKHSIRASLQFILYNLQNCDSFEQLSKNQDFLMLHERVYAQRLLEQQREKAKLGIQKVKIDEKEGSHPLNIQPKEEIVQIKILKTQKLSKNQTKKLKRKEKEKLAAQTI